MRALTAEAVSFLVTAEAQRELERLQGGELEALNTLTALRKTWGPERAAWLYDQAVLRRRARAKFPQADRMLFEAEALEQASAWPVALWRAENVFAPYARVADLGAGLGGDALALAAAGKEVLAVERDPLRAALLERNAASLGLSGRLRVVRADWRTLDLEVEAAFADPARRRSGRRTVRLEAMEPPFSDLLKLAQRLPALAVKLAPGLDKSELPPAAGLGFVSMGGELKEALAGLGSLRWPEPWAAALPDGAVLRGPEARPGLSEPLECLLEPDPAVIRAGLVGRLALELGAHLLAEGVAYLTAVRCPKTPLARGWRLVRHGPYRFKTLKSWLRELDASAVNVKRRRSPVDPAALAARLPRGSRGPEVTVFLTRLSGRSWMLLGLPA
ncbi:THUMP-like domain-containing protein [Oceanithermus sp.]